MKKKSFRDFHYNNSDIILAIIILIIACILIMWRVKIIMAYPKTLSQAAEGATTVEEALTNDPGSTAAVNKAAWKDDKLASEFSCEISGETEADIVQGLVDAGLFTSAVDFETVCKEVDVNPSDVKAGEYVFREGLDKGDIAKLVTKG